ncbi:kinase-like domain-containing protein [Chlamydoabsidia padenii]|nr:kinase-like domain-containing protein [Chlamydoabsidia padenii]
MDTIDTKPRRSSPQHSKRRPAMSFEKMGSQQQEEDKFQTTIPKDPPTLSHTDTSVLLRKLQVSHRLPLRPLEPNIRKPDRQQKRTGATKVHVVTDEQVPRTMVDKELDRSYTTMQFLGEGGFARCYQVRDQDGHTYAAKVVAKASLEQEKYRIKLHSEIITHGLMKHPRIVRFYNFFEDDHNVYLILELCENKTLAEMLKTRRHFTEPEVRYYMIQLLDACTYMHEQQVVHRDIKLSNIFLDHDMNVKLGDFGLSALLKSDQDRKRTVCGTPNYMAPEILFGDHRHNQRADIWSVGILVYTLLTGQPPFQMKSYSSTYQKIRENSTRPSYTYPANITLSPEAKDLISKLLVNDPDVRLSISNILEHPFIQYPQLPTSIPLSALKGHPILQYLPLDKDTSLGADRKMVTIMISYLRKALENKNYFMDRHKGTPIRPINWTRHNAFVDRWIDHTRKYGFGYSISDGEMAVLFNDTSTLSTWDKKTYRFIKHGMTQDYQHTPTHLRKKHHLLMSYMDYMDANLAKMETDQTCNAYGIYLVKYFITKEAVIFRLSNNVIQFNFFNRLKLMLTESGKRIIYVDRSRHLEMYELAEAIATGDPELLDLLTYAMDALQLQLDTT